MMHTGLPQVLHMVRCIGFPLPVLGSTKVTWVEVGEEIETFSLGTMNAYEATPPERRLRLVQWHMRLGNELREPSNVTCMGIMSR
jgi:hypothetical protein